MCRLNAELKKLKGQPVEIITESGFKFCGVDTDVDDNSVTLVDDKGRLVLIAIDHIDALIEPQMKLKRVCGDNDCGCKRDHNDDDDDDNDDDDRNRSRRSRKCDKD